MPLRIAFVAGTLGRGGAEKQLTYMVRSLLEAGVDVRIFTVTQGEHYEAVLRAMGAEVQWIGKRRGSILRLSSLTKALRAFKPHVVQSAHFHANLYAGLAARACGAVKVGAIRSDLIHDMESNPFWGPSLLTWVDSLIANSEQCVVNAPRYKLDADRIKHLPNVIDLPAFDAEQRGAPEGLPAELKPGLVVASVGRLIRAKRFDRLIEALAIARKTAPDLRGLIIGDGPERANLQAMATERGFAGDEFVLLGSRDDVPGLLKRASLFALTSDHEGFPNVLLEAMAARLPVVTTPAGDAGRIIREGVNGFVVPSHDLTGFADRLVELSRSSELRERLGANGRARVEQDYSSDRLLNKLLSLYLEIGRTQGAHRLVEALSAR